MQKKWNDLVNEIEGEKLEYNLVIYFIEKHQIETKYSKFLNSYIQRKPKDINVYSAIESYDIDKLSNIEDLENHLETLIPSRDKKINGAFFTPYFITKKMVELLNPKKDDRNIDISCGTGAFLLALIKFYKKTYDKKIDDILKENIYGVDILEYNIARAKILLSIYTCLEKEYIEETSFNLAVENSLNIDINELFNVKFDNVLGNPPYVKYQDLPPTMRNLNKGTWKTVKNGNFNLYFPFFEIAYNIINEGGKVAYITPNNYFTSLAGESVRKYFETNRSIETIIDFSHILVFQVQTYTAITLINKKENEYINYSKIGSEETAESFLKNLSFSKNPYSGLKSKKWRLLKENEINNIRIIENIGTKLKDIVDIKTGIATLKDKVFFVDYISEDDHFYIKEDGTKIEKRITFPVTKITNFKNQEELLLNKKRIIFPYMIEKGNVYLLVEDEFKSQYPYAYNYLYQHKEELLQRDKGKINPDKWFAYGRSQGLKKFGEKLLISTHSANPRFLLDETVYSFFTNGYGLFPKNKSTNTLFDANLHPLSLKENIDVLQKILNSNIMDYFIKRTSTAIAGGHYCYQKNFIELFSIPNLSNDEMKIIRSLSDSELDEYLYHLYKTESIKAG